MFQRDESNSWEQWQTYFKQKTETYQKHASGYYSTLTAKPDKLKSLMQIVKDYGFPIEQHFYETEDGYINRVFRISGPRGSKPSEGRPVVIYQHGLMD